MRVSFLAAVLTTVTQAAYGATYNLTPLHVDGSSNVAVAAINNSGVLTGSYYTNAKPYGAGFVGTSGHFTVLPKLGDGGGFPQYYNPAPTSINNTGAVIGTYIAGGVYVFVWQHDRYIASFGQSVDSPPGDLFPPYITTRDHLSFDQYEGHGDYSPYAGTPKAQSPLHAGGFPLIASTNASGLVAGQSYTFVGQTQTTAVFVGTLAQVQPLLPPHAAASTGGWINDSGQVAGAYRTPHAMRGFIYTAGAYRRFGLPTTPTALVVQGIDGHGRAVGSYTDASGQYGFVYAHGQATQLGSFPAADTLHVGISQSGRQLVLSDGVAGTQTSQSFVITCSGTGC